MYVTYINSIPPDAQYPCWYQTNNHKTEAFEHLWLVRSRGEGIPYTIFEIKGKYHIYEDSEAGVYPTLRSATCISNAFDALDAAKAAYLLLVENI